MLDFHEMIWVIIAKKITRSDKSERVIGILRRSFYANKSSTNEGKNPKAIFNNIATIATA